MVAAQCRSTFRQSDSPKTFIRHQSVSIDTALNYQGNMDHCNRYQSVCECIQIIVMFYVKWSGREQIHHYTLIVSPMPRYFTYSLSVVGQKYIQLTQKTCIVRGLLLTSCIMNVHCSQHGVNGMYLGQYIFSLSTSSRDVRLKTLQKLPSNCTASLLYLQTNWEFTSNLYQNPKHISFW